MNKKIQLLSTSFLLAILVMVGCKKKEEEPKIAPTITLDSASGSSSKTVGYYETAAKFKIYYSITSSNNITSIAFSETAEQSITTNQKPIAQSLPSLTVFNAPTSHKAFYETQIPINASSLTITINVTDSKGLTSSITYVAKTYLSYQVALGASSNTSYGSYLSSNTFNNSYKQTEFAANASKIDITFDQLGNPVSQPMLISTQQRATDKITNGAGTVTTFFQVSSRNFETITANDLANLTPSTSQKIVIEAGKVYEFVSTTLGTKGLIRIKSYDDGGLQTGGGSIISDIKVVTTK